MAAAMVAKWDVVWADVMVAKWAVVKAAKKVGEMAAKLAVH